MEFLKNQPSNFIDEIDENYVENSFEAKNFAKI